MPAFFTKPIITATVVLFLYLALIFTFFYLRGNKPEVLPIKPMPESIVALAKYKIIGTSVASRKIESFTYGNGKTHLLFVGGIHGGYEWNSVLLAYEFLDYLDKKFITVPANITVTVIPSANPDGVFKAVKKEGRFVQADVPTDKTLLASARFNAHDVDLNRNFGCDWQPKSMWKTNVVSGGTSEFSEPEAVAIKNFVLENNPDAVVFWHSQANTVYASDCHNGILPVTLDIMNAYARASGYLTDKSFSSYAVTGSAEGWLASINIPAITVELKTHETVEWEKNLAGIKALFEYFQKTN